MGRDSADSSTPGDQFNPESPGYETTDVNVGGVIVFLGGLAGSLVMFFLVCYGFGILINNLWVKHDGAPSKWTIATDTVPAGKGKNLASNPEVQQKELQRLASNFPEPRLDIDDTEQGTADLHAREDLLLEHYSTSDAQGGGLRIPIERAMELIAQRGLPLAGQTAAPSSPMLVGANKPQVSAPLTTGFARTGFELTVMEARQQKMNSGKSEASAGQEPASAK